MEQSDLAPRYRVEQMLVGDIPTVIEIERQSFSTPWPSSAYRRELEDNQMARYFVALDGLVATTFQASLQEEQREGWRVLLPRSLFPPRQRSIEQQLRLAEIVGYAGLWRMVDEAHITNIAVLPSHRRSGLGQLLLVQMMDLAILMKSRWCTLEVRISNQAAQGLYRKYLFQDAGIRRRYYSDNNEDALIMTTPELTSEAFRAMYERNRRELAERMAQELAPARSVRTASSGRVR